MADLLEQTAEQSAPVSQPAAEPAAPVDDLDELLRQFTDSTSQPQQIEQVSESAAERDRAFAANLNAITEGYGLDAKREQLQAEAQALKLEVDRKDALSAFAEIRGDLPADLFDDRMIWAWVQARNDPVIEAAFQNRVADPRTYQRVLNKLGVEFGDKFRKFETQAEIDHAGIAAAVQSASGKIPAEPPARLGRMGTNEYRQHIKENYGFDPGV